MADTTIQMRPNGPLLIKGDFTIVDSEGNEFPNLSEKPAIALCRCGQSATRPFCDGSHKSCDFISDERATVG